MHPGAPVDIRTHLNIVCIKWQIRHNNKSMVLVQENKGNVFGGNLISISFFFSSLTHVHLNILTCGMKVN